MKTFTLLLLSLALYPGWTQAQPAQNQWVTDKTHSTVKFTVTHMVVSQVEGIFRDFSGTMISSSPDFTDAKIDFTVEVSSVFTDNDSRDSHLKSDDFFDAEKFPKMTFVSDKFTKITETKYELTGDLTIRDVTKKVKFDVYYGGTVKGGKGKMIAGFRASSSINRFDFNLKWNRVTDAGNIVVGPDVDIQLKMEFVQKPATSQ
jgi:polyisoprenoid-binding protein YceI